tara:strand:- start:448 stop:873 length:426 start_codon:yes stop_codon:yes gene_type:complete
MPEKVKVKYKGKEYNINKSYLGNLKGYERTKQIKSIVEKTDRPKLKDTKKKVVSSWTQKFKNKYGNITKLEDISKATGVPRKALTEVIKKGQGAYYSAGSRPGQTPQSWSRARMYAFLMGGEKVRKVDNHIIEKYKIKFKD